MKVAEQLAELEALAERLAVRVSYEPMAGLVQNTGGLCRVKGEYRVIIDRRFKPPERVQILAEALGRFDLEGVEVGDETRELVESSRPRRSA
jgi:hypothetical protein